EKRKIGRFHYSDYGIPDEQTTFIVSIDAYLSASREHARAFIQATRKGYAYSLDQCFLRSLYQFRIHQCAVASRDQQVAGFVGMVDG
ncbi:ABC transporter substrate-binding protein, partial [Rhizobium ruizarguesonis]